MKVGWGRKKFSVDSDVGCGEFRCMVDVIVPGDADVNRHPDKSSINRACREGV